MRNKLIKCTAIVSLIFGTIIFNSCTGHESVVAEPNVKTLTLTENARVSFELEAPIQDADAYFWKIENSEVYLGNTPSITHRIDKKGLTIITLQITKGNTRTTYRYEITTVYGLDHEQLFLSDIPLTIEVDRGKIWGDTYENVLLQKSIFTLSHSATQYDNMKYWQGFTVSNSQDKLDHKQEFSTKHFGTMGNTQTSEFPLPFLVAYSSELPENYKKGQKIDLNKCATYISFTTNNDVLPIEVDVALSPYTFYTVTEGNEIANEFKNGDYLKIIMIALDENEKVINEAPLEHYLVDYRKGYTPIIRDWTTLDLRSLENAHHIAIFMDSSDKGEYGINTPLFFTMKNLVVYRKH